MRNSIAHRLHLYSLKIDNTLHQFHLCVAKMYSIIYASFLGEAGVYVSIAHNTVIEQHANYFKECFILILRCI